MLIQGARVSLPHLHACLEHFPRPPTPKSSNFDVEFLENSNLQRNEPGRQHFVMALLFTTGVIFGCLTAGLSPSSHVISASVSRLWSSCEVTSAAFGAVGDGVTSDTAAIRAALEQCDRVILPKGGTYLSGPVNLTSNQELVVDGTMLASSDRSEYPLVLPVMGYGWGNDENCFPPGTTPHKVVVGSLRYSPVVGAYHATNVTITGSGVIDGQGQQWWENCTRCHYPPHNNSSFCEVASRPKLIETQFVNGFRVLGAAPHPHIARGRSHPRGAASHRQRPAPSAPTPFVPPTPPPPVWPGTLTLQNSPFWTVTPSYTQNIHVANLRILAPMDRIGNTDGVNLDSCRNAVVENIWIQNSDDGVCIKSGLNGFGLNLGIPTENVLVRNVTCSLGGRGGFAIGSEMSGGLRNVTFRDSTLHGERGINIKPSVGRGGCVEAVTVKYVLACHHF